jgi:hypothetical protein
MSGVISLSSETPEIVCEGYMTKRAIKSGRNWKRRYFTLFADGALAYKQTESPADQTKRTVQLGSNSRAMVLKELSSEGGIFIEGPTHESLYLKAESMKEAKQWIQVG